MKARLLSSTALSTCHKTGFLNPHALRNMLTAITRAYFEVVVKPMIDKQIVRVRTTVLSKD